MSRRDLVVDLFAGPGGWDEGARQLDVETVGIEWDKAACATAEAAGHKRIQADVAEYSVEEFAGKTRGLIASPPCTLFSSAGSGLGNLVIDVLARGIVRTLRGEECRDEVRAQIYPVTLAEREKSNAKRKPEKRWTQERVEAQAKTDAFIASLVIEPARWLTALKPQWVALEQVPEVLPLWQAYIHELRRLGYSAWVGVLNSADYGVPQTRQRAILIARRGQCFFRSCHDCRRVHDRTCPVHPPIPTHAEHGQENDLFGVTREKWVSMAQALGWDESDRLVHPRGSGMTERHGPRDDRAGDEPAMTVTSKGRSWLRMGNAANASVRHATEPAPTVLFGHRAYAVTWHGEHPKAMVGAGITSPESAGVVPRTLDEPAHTITGKGTAAWCYDRPATTVVGSFSPDVISPPGYRTDVSRQNAEGGVRVTVAEGGVLQSFPADYPWQGSRTKQYEQVGNAIPPRLARHILATLVDQTTREAVA